ncbi:MAG: hypothetical protein ACPGWR_03745 [Ardenticatenaceae bacterium]
MRRQSPSAPPPNEPYEAHFHSYLEDMWRQMSQQLVANGHVAQYVIAVGLVSYGNLHQS